MSGEQAGTQQAGGESGQTAAASAATTAQAGAQPNGAGTQQAAAGQQAGQNGTQANGNAQGAQQAAQGQQQGTQKPGSAATGDGEDAREAPAAFPDDWREQLAGEDEALLSSLKRYRSPAGMAKAFKELRAKLSQGAHLKDKPGDDATDEEKAAWRAQQGVPKTADDYEKGWKAPEGFILSDGDKQLMKGFAASVHGKEWTQTHFNDAMAWYVEHQAAQQAARQDMDLDFQAEAIRELKAEMGPADYRRGIQSIQTLRQFETEEGLLNAVLDNARMPDGRKLGDIPGVVRMVMAWAGEIDPQARIAPSDPNMSGAGLEARIAEIEGWMGSTSTDDYAKYWSNPTVQAEYGRLLEARQKVASRRAA